ncbi:type I iodothyronine deiodinase-like [Branchiostoma floridae x Branchiostoma japonicum]
MKALQDVSLALRFVSFFMVFVTTRAVRTVLGVLSPSLQRKMDIHIAKRSQMCDSSLAMEDYSDLLFTSTSFWTMWESEVMKDLLCETRVGGKAPDAPLLHMDGLTQARLMDFAKKGRPLVVNFGSCT